MEHHVKMGHTLAVLPCFIFVFFHPGGQDSSVGMATRYGLLGPGIESHWGRDFLTRSDGTLGPPSLLYNRHSVFPGGKAVGSWR